MTATMIQRKPNRAAFAAEYAGVEGMVHGLVHRWRRRYGGDPDEILSAAHDGFVRAYLTWDGKAQFSTWCWVQVWSALRRERRGRLRRERHVRPDGDLYGAPDGRGDWLEDLLDGLSADARLVVETAVAGPPALRMALLEAGLKTDRPAGLRRALRAVLGEMGWNVFRVERAFREVGEALR